MQGTDKPPGGRPADLEVVCIGCNGWVGRQYCQSSTSSLKFDLMHHWPFLPSTGTAEKTLTCANNSTWRTASWSNDQAQYTVEYTWNNTATITLTYKILYPG